MMVISGDKKKEMQISKSEYDKIFQEAELFKVFTLPSTDYTVDFSDDVYHFGVSLFVQKDVRKYVHKVPTGVFVCVSTLRISNDQVKRFSNFVNCVSLKAQEKSGIEIPLFVKLKWEKK